MPVISQRVALANPHEHFSPWVDLPRHQQSTRRIPAGQVGGTIAGSYGVVGGGLLREDETLACAECAEDFSSSETEHSTLYSVGRSIYNVRQHEANITNNRLLCRECATRFAPIVALDTIDELIEAFEDAGNLRLPLPGATVQIEGNRLIGVSGINTSTNLDYPPGTLINQNGRTYRVIAPSGDVQGRPLHYQGQELRVIYVGPTFATAEADEDVPSASEEARRATAEDCPELPNGHYEVDLGDPVHICHFEIYTVQNSNTSPDLNGCRIIRTTIDGQVRGCAFLMSDYSLNVWRRFTGRRTEDWWLNTYGAFETINRHRPIAGGALNRDWRFGMGDAIEGSSSTDDVDSDCVVRVRCRTCNARCTGSLNRIASMCTAHYRGAGTPIDTITDARQRRITSSRRNFTPPVPTPTGTVRDLPRDELGMGEIL